MDVYFCVQHGHYQPNTGAGSCPKCSAQANLPPKLQAAAEADKVRIAKFFSMVTVARGNGCWQWNGAKSSNGYGSFSNGVKTVSAHSYSFEFFNGSRREGLWIDHICRNRACVNPAHMRAVTPVVNAIENSESVSAKAAARTHCKYGHELNEQNVRLKKGKNGQYHRSCRACIQQRERSVREANV